MFETVKQGILGLGLFIMNWAGPSSSQAEIEIRSVKRTETTVIVSCRLKASWDRKLEDLVDAGVPLRFRFSAQPESGPAFSFTRTLAFNVADYTYSFRDTLPDYVKRSAKFPVMDLAQNAFSEWEVELPRTVKKCMVEAAILPSYVSRLKRSVDMSDLWGQNRVAKEVEIK